MTVFKLNHLHPVKPQDLTVSDITKNSAILKWSGSKGDVIVKRKVKLATDFKDKVAGSVVENPHIVKMIGSKNLLLPDSPSLYEFIQTRYDGIKELGDGKICSLTNSIADNQLQFVHYFNVIEMIERYDSNYFSDEGATTVAEKVAIVKNEVMSAKYSLNGFGSGAAENKLTTAVLYTLTNVWENTTASQITNSQAVAEVKRSYTNAAFVARIDADGIFSILAYAPAADSTTPSALNVDYVKFELELNVYEKIENVSSGYMFTGLDSNTEYTVKVVNKIGESDEVTFTTKEITYKEVTITADFKDKIVGSVEENPNKASWIVSSWVPPPDIESDEFTQSGYNSIYKLDGITENLQTTTASRTTQAVAFLNIVESIDRYDRNYFIDRGATTLSEKTIVLREQAKKLEVSSSGFGSGAAGVRYILAWWDSKAWQGGYAHTSDVINTVSREIDIKTYLLDNGYVILNVRTNGSNETIPSNLSIDYISAKITILVEED
ncbi:hypothetical protein [Candidatus Enterococcus clewellii]|uniref:Uncharacterized protein n=1 Tax=Candidatus Enterococcus clewellii TaxID=1834193 RepID=A0A242K358_9ENTE|nr:hypothetical protein [Enterococcus sp. 9E7_DIV0242]OTP13439.1 hypothetical protein A5888_002917 [Enterococcus sp. 9E7_DIV0242]